VSPVSFLKLSSHVASFYGFRNTRELLRGLKRVDRPKIISPSASVAIAHLATAAGAARPQEPVLAFFATPSPAHLPGNLLSRETGEFGLCVVGTKESVGEMVILKTISAIVSEWGAPVARVRLNALGDRDSRERYTRELFSYVRRRTPEFDAACQENLAKNPFAAYRCAHTTCRALLSEGPRSVNFLSEKSRAHFRAVLEQVEGLGFSYELDDLLVGDDREQHIVFAVDLKEPDATILGSTGGRWDEYLRRTTGRKEGAVASASIYFRKKGAARSNFTSPKKTRSPKVFFVQLGSLAKLQGLSVLDMLWRAGVPVSQSFDSSRLSPQLGLAGGIGVSHVLIMGQREALDGTIIVREVKNSSQTIVELAHLPRILKSLRT